MALLSDLRRYLDRVEAASLIEIAIHLDVEPAVAEHLLESLRLRGDVRRVTPAACGSGGCAGACHGGCGLGHLAVYARPHRPGPA